MTRRLRDLPNRLWEAAWRHPALVAIALELMLVFYMLRPLLWSAYDNDDIHASQRPMWREYHGLGFWEHIAGTNEAWANNGLLRPLSIVVMDTAFQLLQDRAAYKGFVVAMDIAAWAAMVVFVRVLLRSWEYAAVAGAIGLFAMQTRVFHDPLRSFWGQHPLVVITFFGTLTLAVLASRAASRRRFWLLTGAMGLVWTACLLTYESLYLLTLAPLALIWLTMSGARRRNALAVILLPSVALAGLIVMQRAGSSGASEAYLIGLDPARVAPTFLKQVTGVIPFSYQLLTDHSLGAADGVLRIDSGWSIAGRWDLLAVGAALLLVALLFRGLRPDRVDRARARYLLAVGAAVVLIPSALVGITQAWQNRPLLWGKPYVPVLFSSTGLAIAAVGWWAARPDKTASRSSVPRRVARWGLGTVAALALVLGPIIIEDTNRAVVDRALPRLRWEREAFADQIRGGVFAPVPPGALVIADEANDIFWVNGAFVQWYGGPPGLRLVHPTDPSAAECGITLECYRYWEFFDGDGRLWGDVSRIPAAAISLTTVADSFDHPVAAVFEPSGERMFVVERSGRIQGVSSGVRHPQPVLDLTDIVLSANWEQGLLGMALSPDFPADRRVFLSYTEVGTGAQVIAVALFSPDLTTIERSSLQEVLRVAQPGHYHQGGTLRFGPDGMLWIGLGDGGSADLVEDGRGHGQNPYTLQGTMVRIDVSGPLPYAIPDDNPFADGILGAPEVWAYGLRNPWSFWFDDDAIAIGDVGAETWEEINVLDLTVDPGVNLGWSQFEGPQCYAGRQCAGVEANPPTLAINHTTGACAVIVGPVYRGSAVPELSGSLLYADLCGRWLRSYRSDGTVGPGTTWLQDVGIQVTAFAVDHLGEVYVLSLEGAIYRIDPYRDPALTTP